MINGVSGVIRYLTMKVIGIDASTKCSGIAVYEDGKLVFHNVIDMSKNKDTDARIMLMIVELGLFILKESPDAVYIEDSWNKLNIETTKMLSNIIGAVMYVCAEKKIPFTKLIPSTWRKIVGIPLYDKNNKKLKREELKQEAIKRVKKMYKINCNDDEAEAICIAEAGWLMQDTDLFD